MNSGPKRDRGIPTDSSINQSSETLLVIIKKRDCFQIHKMPHQAFDLTGKTAVVIGGTSGIGRAIARGLAEAGADVVPTSRRLEQVTETSRQIRELGRRSLEVVSDVSDRSSLEHLLMKCIEAFGKV